MNYSPVNISEKNNDVKKFPKELNGIYSKRKVNDPLFILIFLIFLIAFIVIAFKFLGSYENLSFTYITDSIGSKCNPSIKNNEYPYLYYGAQIQNRDKYRSLSLKQVCVKECPKIPEIPLFDTSTNDSFIKYPTLVLGHYCIMNLKQISEEFAIINDYNKLSNSIKQEKKNFNTNNYLIKGSSFKDYKSIDEIIKTNIRNFVQSLFERTSFFLFSTRYIIFFLLVPLLMLILYTILIRISIKLAIWFIISLLILTIALEGLIIFIRNFDFNNNNNSFYSIDYALYLWLFDGIIFLLTWIYQDSIGHFIEYLSTISDIIRSKGVILLQFILLIISLIVFIICLLEVFYIHTLFELPSSSSSEKTIEIQQNYFLFSIIIVLILSTWVIIFFYIVLQFLLSLLITIWIFAGQNKMRGCCRRLFTWTILSNLGSLTLGSILFGFIYIIKILSIFAQILTCIFVFKFNLFSRLIFRDQQRISYPSSCWSGFNWRIKSLYKISYIIIGIEGTSYFQSCKRSFNSLNPNNSYIEKPKYSIHLFKIYLTAIFSILSVPIMMLIDNYFELFTFSIENFKFILAVSFAFSWIIVYYYFILYDMIQETFLFWLCILQKNSDNYPEVLKVMRKIMYSSREPEKLMKMD